MGERIADNMLRSDPSADPIHEIICGARRLKILVQVLELGLFDEIEAFGEAMTAAVIARKCHYNPDVTERLLDTLVCLKLLEKSKNNEGIYAYRNTNSTVKYLTRSKRPSLISCVMSEVHMVQPMIDNMSKVLKSGTSEKAAIQLMNGKDIKNANITPPKSPTNNNSKPTSDNQMMFMSIMDGIAAPCSPALVRAFDLSGHKTAADLGGNSGCIAYELTRTYPNMYVTVFDLPSVVQLARKLQPEGTKSKVQFLAGDFFKDVLPPADLFILSHVIHDWDREKTDILLKKVFDKLPAGGSLLLLEKMLNEDKDGPEPTITMDLVMAMISKGRERTASEYRKLLENHGFRNTQLKRISGYNYYDAILARKPF